MKTNYLKNLAFLTSAAVILSASTLLAQDSTASYTTQPSPATPQLAYGVSQILQLSQAKVGDDTILAYIKNSGNSYGLNADQIIYLRQQGVSSPVINAMLSQPPAGMIAAGSGNPAPPSADTIAYNSQPSQPSAPTSIVGPSVSAIDPSAAAAASTTYYYYQPSYYPYYSYPYSYAYPYCYPAFYPGVSVSLGWGGRWGGGWHGGGGFHGGWRR